MAKFKEMSASATAGGRASFLAIFIGRVPGQPTFKAVDRPKSDKKCVYRSIM